MIYKITKKLDMKIGHLDSHVFEINIKIKRFEKNL